MSNFNIKKETLFLWISNQVGNDNKVKSIRHSRPTTTGGNSERKINKVKYLLTFIFVTLLLTGCSQKRSDKFSPSKLKINNYELNLELAVSDLERAQGLSGRENLADDYGMLFLFDHYGNPGFWMNDMLISIDIVWIKDNVIVGMEKNVPVPENSQNLPIYRPLDSVNRVLEVRAGLADENDWQAGDRVDYFEFKE